MSEQYVHLLIPNRMNFVPRPSQVTAFIACLIEVGSAPLNPTFRIGKLSGKLRFGTDSVTGQRISIPRRDFTQFQSASELTKHLSGLEDYDLVISGQGPASIPPFAVFTIAGGRQTEYIGTYAYDVHCHARKEPVSMCDDPPFGSPFSFEGEGVFCHPTSEATIRIPNAACARFWVEFEFGKWLFPMVGTSLAVIRPSILDHAVGCFGVRFAQGCTWE